MFRSAYKFVARYDEAEDLTQEIFVKLFRSLATYDRKASFETWLTRVTRNRASTFELASRAASDQAVPLGRETGETVKRLTSAISATARPATMSVFRAISTVV